MIVLFLDGLGANPEGRKPTFLEAQGFRVVYPLLPDWDFEESIRVAREAFAAERPDAVVGYSRGGAVALNVETGTTPVVLIAPAWEFRGPARTARAATRILHSEHDPLLPLEGSRKLLRDSGLPESRLTVVGEEHDMDDPAALQALLDALAGCERGPGS